LATTREIRRRIKAVDSTRQITRAMEMVAAARLNRAQNQVIRARPYARKMTDLLGRLSAGSSASHPLMQERSLRTVVFVPVAGDRGLCGSYNANIIRKTEGSMEECRRAGIETCLIPVGRRARDYFYRRGHRLLDEFTHIGEEASTSTAREIAMELRRWFVDGDVDEVRLIYSEFVSVMNHRPTEVRLLPITPAAFESEENGHAGRAAYLYEPAPEAMFAHLLPRFLLTSVYRALAEAKASEHGARMVAMNNATDNAEEMIERLTRLYNRARQTQITTEIIEVVGGAEALREGTA